MGALQKEVIYTIEDIYALPSGERAELIDGKIYYMSPPNIRHQRISSILHATIYNYIKSKNGSCEVFSAPFAVFLNEDDKNYVEPDISIICEKSKLENGRGCFGAPDWIIEIVSPGSRYMDYFTKLFKYHNAGVKEYWIVDPLKNQITTYYFENEIIEQYAFSDKVKVSIYNDFEIDFSEIN